MYKQQEKLNEKVKKQKAELDRKDSTIEMLKSKLKTVEDGSKDFELDVKEKQNLLTKDLNELNKKSEMYLKKLRKSEVSNTSLKTIVLSI